jgi:hypothetical protein
MALHGERVLVVILQEEACTTVLTWPQFEPRLAEFGRAHLPRKRGRMLRRLGMGDATSPAREERPAGGMQDDEPMGDSPSDRAWLEETE